MVITPNRFQENQENAQDLLWMQESLPKSWVNFWPTLDLLFWENRGSQCKTGGQLVAVCFNWPFLYQWIQDVILIGTWKSLISKILLTVSNKKAGGHFSCICIKVLQVTCQEKIFVLISTFVSHLLTSWAFVPYWEIQGYRIPGTQILSLSCLSL